MNNTAQGGNFHISPIADGKVELRVSSATGNVFRAHLDSRQVSALASHLLLATFNSFQATELETSAEYSVPIMPT